MLFGVDMGTEDRGVSCRSAGGFDGLYDYWDGLLIEFTICLYERKDVLLAFTNGSLSKRKTTPYNGDTRVVGLWCS